MTIYYGEFAMIIATLRERKQWNPKADLNLKLLLHIETCGLV